MRDDAQSTTYWRNQKVEPEQTYTYDALYQLITATGRETASRGQQGHTLPAPLVPLPTDDSVYTNYTRAYAYDRGGNLIQIRHSAPASGNGYTTEITVSNRSNRAVQARDGLTPDQVDALFDVTGHQRTLMPGQALDWNRRGELRQVTPVSRDGNQDDREWYRYGSDGMRVVKINEQQCAKTNQVRQVLYLPGLECRTAHTGGTEKESLQVIRLEAAGRVAIRALHWANGQPAGIDNDSLRYSVGDLIGSSLLELDAQAEICSREAYYPYGGTAIWTARSAIEADYKTIRYSGKERDASGLYYYGFRYYQPWIGRWLSADPAGTVDGLNLYRMVRNSPVSGRDAYGFMFRNSSLTSNQKDREELHQAFQTRPSTKEMMLYRSMHFVVSLPVKAIRNSVTEHGGEVSFTFSQSKGAFLEEIMEHQYTAGGVCESLSSHWIVAHAYGNGLFNELYTEGKKGQFDTDALHSVKQLQIAGMGEKNQDRVTDRWLKENSIIPTISGYTSGETGHQGTRKLIQSIFNTPPGYKKISFIGKDYRFKHITAAHTSGQGEIEFFDPNFGEFKFRNKQSFSIWFEHEFWRKSKYHFEAVLGKEFEVASYEKHAFFSRKSQTNRTAL